MPKLLGDGEQRRHYSSFTEISKFSDETSEASSSESQPFINDSQNDLVISKRFPPFTGILQYSDDYSEIRKVSNPFSFNRLLSPKFYISVIIIFMTGLILDIYKSSWIFDYSEKSTTVPKSKPNFIVIIADDVGWNSFGFREFIAPFATPFINSLARQSLILDNYYAQELCTPSRASFLTGRLPISLGLQYGSVEPTLNVSLSLDEVTIAEVLQQEGYSTSMFGKWHQGHHTARYLPTARGFDTFVGFLLGTCSYWTKLVPKIPTYTDFISSNLSCYQKYNKNDSYEYSTFIYRDRAIELINDHNTANPLFLYMSFQASHDPFDDFSSNYVDGIPDDYLNENIISKIYNTTISQKTQQYYKSLYLLDSAVEDIYDALVEKDMIRNTYIIFASDNGGCFKGGGLNGPLRGTKATLFEGGSKVDAFIYSPLLPPTAAGSIYEGLMHVSDWFPTILALAGINYSPKTSSSSDSSSDSSSKLRRGRPLDGMNQLPGWLHNNYPRDHILYNWYTNVTVDSFDPWINGSFAVRNDRYKLMHAYVSEGYSSWLGDIGREPLDSNGNLLNVSEDCRQDYTGNFTYFLFDLLDDPYEAVNLYNSSNASHVEAKESLYTIWNSYAGKARRIHCGYYCTKNYHAMGVWNKHLFTVVPWDEVSRSSKDEYSDWNGEGDGEEQEEQTEINAYPSYCGEYTPKKDSDDDGNSTALNGTFYYFEP